MIVVDLGCCTYGADESVEMLIERFAPHVLFGFDASSTLKDGVDWIRSTTCVFSRRAAWTYDGEIGFNEDGIRGHIAPGGMRNIPCFDFSAWIRTLPSPVVVKMDIEGAEYPIIEKLHADGTDKNIELLMVELHTDWWSHGRENKLPPLRCKVETW